ncbi:MAG: LytR C-terminal domain-containing protein [Arthrobacter sp.]|uniref:LytR C-terminal domain-containing protein n=1 Tax=Arthrobacter sp. TaxID=1667 RepID=UPI003476794D
MSQYANDEFDSVPEFTDRKGIHRNEAEGAARGSGLGLLMGVGVLALVVGIFSFFVLPQFAGSPADTASAGSSDAVAASPAGAGDAGSSEPTEPTGQSAGAAAASTGAATDPAAESSSAAQSSAAGEPTGVADPAEEPGAAAAAVEYAVPVAVYNGSGRAGVAAGGAAALGGGGFTAVSTGNWAKQVDYPVVYFKSDASRATAQEAARVLGIPTVFQTPNIPVEISVVLGRNYG